MSDSDFLSGEILPTDLTIKGNFAAMPQATNAAPGGALVLSSPNPDYDILPSATVEDYLPPFSRWATVGGVILLGGLGLVAGLSNVLKYKVTVQAPAAIRPVGELRVVQSTIEGSVLSISARENQVVNKGDLLATVKDLNLESKLQTKRSQLAGDIQTGIDQIAGVDAQIIALARQGEGELEQSNRSIAGIQAELSRAGRDYQDKKIVSRAEVAEAEANIQTAEQDKQVAETELIVTISTLKSIQAAYAAAAAKSNRYKSTGAAGAISQNQVEEAQLATQQQLQAIAAQQANILKQKQTITRAQKIITSAQARLAKTKAALNPSQAESVQIQQKIAREHANGTTIVARLQQDRQKLWQQRIEIINQIATKKQEIAQISTDLKPTQILAPISGTIQDLNLRNHRQVVHPGDRLAQIIPTGTPLTIKASVSVADIDKVTVGQKVQMRVSACPYTDRGLLTGKVTEVAADAKQLDKTAGTDAPQQRDRASNASYEVTIEPNALALGNGATKCQIRSGMEGRAEIISKEETVFRFLLRKARLLFDP
jgi:multidrug efflux pump subunit AcrA (membrane-fusion protein)